MYVYILGLNGVKITMITFATSYPKQILWKYYSKTNPTKEKCYFY